MMRLVPVKHTVDASQSVTLFSLRAHTTCCSFLWPSFLQHSAVSCCSFFLLPSFVDLQRHHVSTLQSGIIHVHARVAVPQRVPDCLSPFHICRSPGCWSQLCRLCCQPDAPTRENHGARSFFCSLSSFIKTWLLQLRSNLQVGPSQEQKDGHLRLKKS